MGNAKSRYIVNALSDTQIDELSNKTKYKREEILKLHSEFMVLKESFF